MSGLLRAVMLWYYMKRPGICRDYSGRWCYDIIWSGQVYVRITQGGDVIVSEAARYTKGAKVYPASRRRSNKRVGLKRQLTPHCVPWLKKIYHGIQKAVHQFRFKNVEQHLLLGSGGNQNLRPSGRRPPTRTFHPPRRYSQAWRTCSGPSLQSQWWQ